MNLYSKEPLFGVFLYKKIYNGMGEYKWKKDYRNIWLDAV